MNVSPVTMHHYKENPNTLSVIVQIFSIIGGLFMVAKFSDTYLSSFWAPKNKSEEVPLGET